MKKKKYETGKFVKEIVGAEIGLGVGSTVLGGMGQGAIAGQVITPAAKMMGPVASAGMGMGVVGMIDNLSSNMKKKKYKM